MRASLANHSGNQEIDGLLPDVSWDGTAVTYAFATSVSGYGYIAGNPDELDAAVQDDLAVLQHMQGADYTADSGGTVTTGLGLIDNVGGSVSAGDPDDPADHAFPPVGDGSGSIRGFSNYATKLDIDHDPGARAIFDTGSYHTQPADPDADFTITRQFVSAFASATSTADFEPEIAFVSGVASNLSVAATSYGAWNDDKPATYGSQSDAFKWGDPHAVTAGGYVHYYFDPASGWSAAEQHGFIASMALWSALANVEFIGVSSAAAADFTIVRGNDGKAFASIPNTTGTVGSSQLGQAQAGGIVSIDTSGGFGPIIDPGVVGAFERKGGYPYDTIVHELGHVLGLGHGGPYNEGDGLGDVPARQFGAYDSRLWTIMSYIEPTDTSAPFFDSYDVTGTRWGDAKLTDGSYAVRDPFDGKYYPADPTTPMLLDILAIQRIYGAAVSGPLDGGNHTFGFNCNIVGDVADFFDFTINRHPVVTLWATGAGNTLDLSGWATKATVDLTPGAFSSANGMINNICVAGIFYNAVGGDGNDTINGNDRDNHLSGNAGNDILDGRTGHDTLAGGTGNDTYTLDDVSAVGGTLYYDEIVEAADGGYDIAYVAPTTLSSYVMADNLDKAVITGTGFFSLYGNDIANNLTGNDTANILHGEGGNDVLYGLAGRDVLFGGAGHDTLVGGAHNDFYYLESVDPVPNGMDYDEIVETADGGYDTAFVTPDGLDFYYLADNVEEAEIVDEGWLVLFGNEIDNMFIGNADINYLYGRGGADTLDGGDGHDQLFGGLGNDVFILDDLTFIDDQSGWEYDGVNEAAGEGTDTVFVTPLGNFRYYVEANVENVVVTGSDNLHVVGNDLDNALTGNAATNTLYGQGGDDWLDGGDGLDQLFGGLGDDVFILDDLTFIDDQSGWEYDGVNEAAGEGIDTVFVTPLGNLRYYVDANVENVAVTGSDNLQVVGNDLANVLTGNAATNTLYGQGGDDTLIGGAGPDALYGGTGNDTFYVDTNSDMVRENTDEGYDRVLTTATFGLYATAEIELLKTADDAGASAIELRGNDFAQTIMGNAGANVIRGRGGSDTLIGGASADTLDGGDGTDTASYEGSATGVDVDLATGTGSGGDAQGDTLVGIENLTGSDHNDVLTGDPGVNVISGNGGRDYIASGNGNDTIYGGDKGDFLFGNRGIDLIAPGAGADKIDGGNDFDRVWYGDSPGGVSVDLANGVGSRNDAAGDTYTGIERVTGSAFSDSIVGNEIGNAIRAGGGDDVVYGKAGRDVIEGQGGRDQLYGGGGNDNILGGRGNDKLYGNSGFDKLYGGAGNDQLTGGADADYFIFETEGSIGFGGDIVHDFKDGIDRLDMRGVYSTSDPTHAPVGFDDLTIGAWTNGVKIVFEADQIIYLDDAATGIAVADIGASDFLFA